VEAMVKVDVDYRRRGKEVNVDERRYEKER
jgi:hypothetical protein